MNGISFRCSLSDNRFETNIVFVDVFASFLSLLSFIHVCCWKAKASCVSHARSMIGDSVRVCVCVCVCMCEEHWQDTTVKTSWGW